MTDHHLIESVKRHEGLRLEAYQDTEGVWTIGYGTNLQTLRITEAQAEKWLLAHLDACRTLADLFPEFARLDTRARRNVFVEMIYNLGPGGVAKFKNMLAALREQDWTTAAREMLDSKWARQVGKRAERLAKLMREGQYAA